MTINDVAAVDALCKGKTAKELEEMSKVVWEWIKEIRTIEAMRERRNYRAGEKVEFTMRGGRVIQGVVRKVNVKTLSLHQCTDGRTWKVAFSYARKVA